MSLDRDAAQDATIVPYRVVSSWLRWQEGMTMLSAAMTSSCKVMGAAMPATSFSTPEVMTA